MRILKLSLIIPILFAVFTLPLVINNRALAVDEEAKKAACEGLGSVGGDCDKPQASSDINSLIATVINVSSWIVGVTAVLMIIIGGFKYVTANGDTNKIASAKTTLIYAIVGLVIVALSQGIVRFVLREATTEHTPVSCTLKPTEC